MVDPTDGPSNSDGDDYNDIEFENPDGFFSTWGIPLVIALLGIGAGYMVNDVMNEDARTVVTITADNVETVKDNFTEDELALLSADGVNAERDKLKKKQAEVDDLKAQLATKTQALETLEKKNKKRSKNAKKASEERKAMEAEIEELKARLMTVETERDDALQELEQTVRELNVQIRETKKAKREAARYKDLNTMNSWESFSANAKIAVCGELWVSGKRRNKRCHDSVTDILGPDIKRKFEACVDTYQSTPLFLRVKNKNLPGHAMRIPKNNFTKNKWYIQFCDPSLPEGVPQNLGKVSNTPGSNEDSKSSYPEENSWDDLDDLPDDADLDDLPD